MATTTSFKQQCPSCEAMVPIRDPALVGRKIDCPKCKYRFVVEKPEDEEDDSSDTPAPTKNGKKTNGVQTGKPGSVKAKAKPTLRRRDEDEDEEDDRPQKKKSGASTTVILGGVLGLLALGLLGFGAMFAFGVFGGSAKTDSGSSSGSGSSSSSSSNSGPQAASDATPGADVKKDEPGAAGNVGDISNLLPNDTEAVVNYQIDKLSASSFRDAALQTTGAFNEAAFKSTFGFPLHDSTTKDGLQRVVTALNNSKHWVFTAVRTMKPIKKEKLIESLGLEALPPVNGLAVYSAKQDMDGLSNLLIKANRPHDDFQVCLLDGQTLIFADPVPMAKFLADGGKPKQLTQTDAPAPPPPAAGSPTGSPMPGGSPTGSPMPGGSPTGSPYPGGSPNGSPPPGMMMPPGMTMPPGMSPPGGAPASAPAPAVAGSYLTINPSLKALFDKLEKPDQPTLFSIVLPAKDSLVEEFDRYAQDRVFRVLKAKGIGADDPIFGKAFDKQQKNVKLEDLGIRLVGVSLSAFSQDKFGGAIALDWNNEAVVKKMGDAIRPQIDLLNALANGEIAPGAPPPGGFPPGGSPFPMPGLTPSSPPGGSSSPFPRGTSSPMPGGLTPSSPPGGGYPGSPGGGYPGSPGGGYPGSPGGSGFPGGNPADAKRGPLDFVVDRSVMALSFTLPFKNDIVFGEVALELGQFMIHLKGESELISTRSRIHELASALSQYVKANGHFPRGTADRPTGADQFAGWAPDQRVSWMAEMVPYLGDGEFQGIRVDPAKSWQEGANLSIAGVLIPQFLGRPNPLAPPLGHYPGVAPEVAATNYVGVAGVGLDAAEYAADNPNAGIFGYNRETKPADVKRGLDKTIALLQVPPEEGTPWLAGGGATVRGVSDGPDAVKPFVCAEYQGKRGTFAIMGDGKVRFIPETIDPKIFRTMCLIAGGEKIENLDKIAPVVTGEVQPELKAEAAPVAATAPAPPAAQPPVK
jgi:Protein of unknown function (DUF1559)